jgi:parallel beta-helix repeat protein
MATVVISIAPVRAEFGDIYIRADGRVDPPAAPISTADNDTYVFTSDIATNGSFFVQRDNVVIDGAGYTLQGTEVEKGISLSGRTNVTIMNVDLRGFGEGIRLEVSSAVHVCENNLTGHVLGIFSSSSNNVSITDNNITGKGVGVWLAGSSDNTVVGNDIGGNDWGLLCFVSSNDNFLSGNAIHDGEQGIQLYQSTRNHIVGNNVTDNSECGVFIQEAAQNRLYHNNFVNNSQQVHFASSGGANIWDHGYPDGGNYWSDYAGSDLFSGPEQNQPGSDGLGDTPYTIDSENQDTYPLMYPQGAPPPAYTLTVLSVPNGVTFTANGIARLTPWSRAYDKGASVTLSMPETQTIADAVYQWDQWSDGAVNRSRTVTLTTNHTLTAYYTGPYYELAIASSTGGTTNPAPGVYRHLNMSSVDTNALAEAGYMLDHWELDGDNVEAADPISVIMDTNHEIRAVFQSTTGLHDVAVSHVASSKSVVGQGCCASINVTVANHGDYTENLNLTIYANTTLIRTQELTLSSGSAITVPVIWNSSGFAKGTYRIEASIPPVLNETNTDDNTLVDGWMLVTLPGDVDGDRAVDIYDVVRIAGNYGKPPPLDDPNSDIDGDGDVDIFDIVAAAGHYGETW